MIQTAPDKQIPDEGGPRQVDHGADETTCRQDAHTQAHLTFKTVISEGNKTISTLN